jgi:uncharacterized protein
MTSTIAVPSGAQAQRRIEYLRGFALLVIISVIGLYIVKWNPYFHRALTAAAKHSIGNSILSGKSASPPAPSLAAALDYFRAYFKAIWQAMVLGLLVAATIEAFLPRDWIARTLGRASLRSSLLGGVLALPGMMCSCCTAPVAIGFRKSGASAGSAAAFFLGNPTLNPAVLVFLVFTLGWPWAALRIAFGVPLVLLGAILATRLAGKSLVLPQPALAVSLPADGRPLARRWLESLVRLVVTLVPGYIIVVLVLGAFRAVLFPAIIAHAGNNPALLVGLAAGGTLFVIPTAGEIPIIQTLQAYGLGSGAAGVLLLTLAPLSLASLVMLHRTFPARVLVGLAALTAVAGLFCGLAAIALRL